MDHPLPPPVPTPPQSAQPQLTADDAGVLVALLGLLLGQLKSSCRASRRTPLASGGFSFPFSKFFLLRP